MNYEKNLKSISSIYLLLHLVHLGYNLPELNSYMKTQEWYIIKKLHILYSSFWLIKPGTEEYFA